MYSLGFGLFLGFLGFGFSKKKLNFLLKYLLLRKRDHLTSFYFDHQKEEPHQVFTVGVVC